MSNILTIDDVAKKLQMSKTTIYKYAEQGKIPSFKIGTCRRFFEEEVIAFLQSCSQKSNPKTTTAI
jgi:PTS system nitrogen regulatory IIA component